MPPKRSSNPVHETLYQKKNPLSGIPGIREVVDDFIPSVMLTVFYNDRTEVFNGLKLLPNTIMAKPDVYIGREDMGAVYTLVMIDPKVLGSEDPRMREHLHWLITDIPAGKNSSYGRTIVEYEPPSFATGIHPYIFLLFKQRTPYIVRMAPSKDYFNTRNFAVENSLGAPVAAVYFNAIIEYPWEREMALRLR